MKVKKEYIILAILIVGLSLYLLLHSRDRTHYALPTLPDVAESEISRIEITKPDTDIVLEKREDEWTLSQEGYPADTDKVESMLDILGKLTLTALVSESKSYERYDLVKGKRITVKAWAGKSLKRDFELGKTAPSHRHTFVKVAGDNRVYHARQNFRGRFDQSVENLRDKKVLRFSPNEIQQVDIRGGEKSLSLMRKAVPVEVKAGQEGEAPTPKEERVWESAEGKKVDESKLNRLLATLSNLNCSAYMPDRKKETFTQPVYTLELKGAETHTLRIFEKINKEDKSYPAISSQNDFPFVLSDYLAERIMVPLDGILANEEKKDRTS